MRCQRSFRPSICILSSSAVFRSALATGPGLLWIKTEWLRRALAPGGRVALVEYRAEGTSAQHIRPEHRMSVEQVLREWEPAGFELIELNEELPTQHLFLFRAAGPKR